MTVYILSFFIALMSLASFYLGLRVGQGYNPTPEIKRAVKRVFKGQPQETEEQRKQRIISENIENYGTKMPQKDVI